MINIIWKWIMTYSSILIDVIMIFDGSGSKRMKLYEIIIFGRFWKNNHPLTSFFWGGTTVLTHTIIIFMIFMILYCS